MKSANPAKHLVIVFTIVIISIFPARAGNNLIINGSFDDERGSLVGWKSKYTSHLERAYVQNHKFVSVVEEVGSQRDVLKLECDAKRAINEGVKVDAFPVKFKPGQRFKLSARAKSTGPSCRFLVQGFRWRPDVKPHKYPKFEELRRVYRFGLLYFNEPETGPFSRVSKDGSWDYGKMYFPDREQTELGQSFLERVDFLMIHIVAIDGKAGNLYIDDVKMKRID